VKTNGGVETDFYMTHGEPYNWQQYADNEDDTVPEFDASQFVQSHGEERFGQTYRRILGAQVMAVVEKRDRIAGELEAIEPQLAQLYTRYPAMRPENIRGMQAADRRYLGYLAMEMDGNTRITTAGLPENVARTIIEGNTKRTPNDVQELAVAIAAVSARRPSNPWSEERYQDLRKHDAVRRDVVTYMRRNLSLVERRGVLDLTGYQLEHDAGMTPSQVGTVLEAGRLGLTQLPHLEAPPLHLSQLIVDIMNNKRTSVTAQPPLVARFRQENAPAMSSYDEQTMLTYYKQYLGVKFQYDGRPEGDIASVLAECDLAERQGFWDAPQKQQQRTAARTAALFARITNLDALPEAASNFVRTCQSLQQVNVTR